MNGITRFARPLLLVAASVVATGCANSLTAVGLPAGSPWSKFTSFFLSPYDDLNVVTTGTGIAAELQRGIEGADEKLRACEGPAGEHVFVVGSSGSDPEACPADYRDLGLFYPYTILVTTQPSFTPGSVTVISDADGATALSFALARNATSTALNVDAGFSEGTIPARPTTPDDLGYYLDNYTALLLGPVDAAFDSAQSLGTDGLPNIICSKGGEGLEANDLVLFRASALSGSLTCGTRTININITPPYKSVGDCISDARKRFCAGNGLKGTALASCNAAQIGACQATFNVPSRLARQLEAGK